MKTHSFVSALICKTLLLALICLPNTFSLAYAETTKQKVVMLKGRNSLLMEGDPDLYARNKPLNYRKDRVLPSLLSRGWRIISLHINDKSKENTLYGYAVLEFTEEKK